MTSSRLIAVALAVTLALMVGQHAKADFIFSSSSALITPPGGDVTAPSGDSTVSFNVKAKQKQKGGLSAPATIDFGVFALLDNAVATTYTDNYSFDYAFEVTIVEGSGKAPPGAPQPGEGTFNISGTLTGYIQDTNGVFSSSFTNTYNTPLSQTQTIGNWLVTLTLDNTGAFFTQSSPPDPTGSNSNYTVGGFSVNVTATPVAVPEPASLALLAVAGVAGFGYFGWRRKLALA